MKKYLPFILAIPILLVVYLLGFYGANALMKNIVGHGNEVLVPDLSGVKFDVARKKCKKIGLYLREIDRQNDDNFEKNTIITQKPHKGIRTKKFRSIDVVLSNGPELVKVPYLDNIGVSEAMVRLQNIGLKLGKKTYRYSDQVTKNKIIYSQPLADHLVAKGKEISIVISLGKYPKASNKKNEHLNLLDKIIE